MDKELEAQIADAEEQLRLAMLASDVKALNQLLAQSLVFTNHLGQRLGKEEDLAAHESGALIISKLETSEQQIMFVNGGDVAVVSVRAQIAGKYAGQPAGGDFLFTSRPLKNVGEAGKTRQKQARKRSLRAVNEHSEPVFNAVLPTQVVFQQPARV